MKKLRVAGKRFKQEKILTWKNVSLIGEAAGWFTERLDKNEVVLERSNQKIVARRFPDSSWKVEYYENDRLEDMSGITKADFAKREMAEMAIRKLPFN